MTETQKIPPTHTTQLPFSWGGSDKPDSAGGRLHCYGNKEERWRVRVRREQFPTGWPRETSLRWWCLSGDLSEWESSHVCINWSSIWTKGTANAEPSGESFQCWSRRRKGEEKEINWEQWAGGWKLRLWTELRWLISWSQSRASISWVMWLGAMSLNVVDGAERFRQTCWLCTWEGPGAKEGRQHF